MCGLSGALEARDEAAEVPRAPGPGQPAPEGVRLAGGILGVPKGEAQQLAQVL